MRDAKNVIESLADTQSQSWEFCCRLKMVLSGPREFLPFQFQFQDGSLTVAQNSGLEGFLYTWRQLEGWRGEEGMLHFLPYGVEYVSAILGHSGWKDARLSGFKEKWKEGVIFKYRAFREFVESIVHGMRGLLERNNPSYWLRHSSIYQVYTRAFNLEGLRKDGGMGVPNSKMTGRLFQDVEATDLPAPFMAVRWTGTYPVGKICQKGNAGGSPFAIRDHTVVDSVFGDASEVRTKVKNLEKQGIRTIFEFSPNHTAVDAWLLEQDPGMYIHVTEEPDDKTGYFEYVDQRTQKTYWLRHGGYLYDAERFYWNDTLQLDLSNLKTRRALTHTIKSLVKNYGVHGFRVDMAYQLLHEPYLGNWGEELQFELGAHVEDEFFWQLITEVKNEYPHVAFIAEGFNSWDKLNAVGFDVIYSKNEMGLPGGLHHEGWYNALQRQKIWELREAIRRAAFLHWQKGGASMLAFIGHHDLPSPLRVFGDWVWGAAFLTLFLPTARNWYAGTEAGYENPCSENQKMITFNEPSTIDWHGMSSSWGRFVRHTLQEIDKIWRDFGGAPEMHPLEPMDLSEPWVGFLLRPVNEPPTGRKVLVLANMHDSPIDAHIHLPKLGVSNFTCHLEKRGEQGQQFIVLS